MEALGRAVAERIDGRCSRARVRKAAIEAEIFQDACRSGASPIVESMAGQFAAETAASRPKRSF
jgi:hypothetical protein